MSSPITTTMAPKSDIIYDLSAFDEKNVDPAVTALNQELIALGKIDIKWWDITAEEYRKRRVRGQTPFSASPVHPQGKNGVAICASSRGDGATSVLRYRVFRPRDAEGKETKPAGLFYHTHGGGFVLGSSAGQDLLLAHVSNKTNLTIVSVDYRLAPEHPYPAAYHDVLDFTDWLIENGEKEFGAELSFVGGESAGGTLAGIVLLHLREVGYVSKIKGAVLNYGCFDMSYLPSAHLAHPDTSPILDWTSMVKFLDAFMPTHSVEFRKRPEVSPGYNDLKGLCNALFIVGTKDALIDDSVLMHFRWVTAGNEAVFRLVPGAPHGFMIFDGNNPGLPAVAQGWKIMVDYLLERLNA